MQKNIIEMIGKDRKYDTILGIKVLSTHKQQLLTSLERLVTHSVDNPKLKLKVRVVTPNPELVLMSLDNPKLKDALNSADFSIPDGIGLSQAVVFNDLKLPDNKILKFIYGFIGGVTLGIQSLLNQKQVLSKLEVIKGRELFLDLVGIASKNKWRVFLLGGEDNEARVAADVLMSKFKNLSIKSLKGPMLNNNSQPVSKTDIKIQSDVIKTINEYKPNLVFVAFKNPKQEIWAYENLPILDTNLIMSVGGTFRYVGGIKSLPPDWMEKTGLEWVWRLLTDPFRIKRILNAFPIFPLKIFINKVNS